MVRSQTQSLAVTCRNQAERGARTSAATAGADCFMGMPTKPIAMRGIVRVTMLILLLSGQGAWEAFAVPLASVSFADPNLQGCVQRVAQARGWSDSDDVIS